MFMKKKDENKWLCFFEKFIRKNSVVAYELCGLMIVIITPNYSFTHTLNTPEDAKKWLNYLHDELRNS